MKTINPATGKTISEYEETPFSEIETIIERANSAQRSWKEESFESRATYLKKIAELLKDRKQALAELMAEEMGKPLSQGVGEA